MGINLDEANREEVPARCPKCRRGRMLRVEEIRGAVRSGIRKIVLAPP
jgi:hypothetical protein